MQMIVKCTYFPYFTLFLKKSGSLAPEAVRKGEFS